MRQLIVIAVASAIAATAVSFALAQADQPTASTSATDRQVVTELQRLNRSIGLSRRFGLRKELPASLSKELDRQTGLLLVELDQQTDTVAHAIGRMCRALTDQDFNCPPAY
jgi:hypothetical protein